MQITDRIPILVAAVCAAAILISSFAWIVSNPLPATFDEAIYANAGIIDAWAVRHQGLRGFHHNFYFLDRIRPPAMRVLALPVTIFTGAPLTVLRAISLIGLLASAFFVALAVSGISGKEAGALAGALVMACPILVLSTRTFGTEYPLFLALGLALAAIVGNRPVLLGVAIGIGLLAKLTFMATLGPMLLVAFPRLRRSLWISVAIGAAMAATWWWHDPVTALRAARTASQFGRDTLGPSSSLLTLGRYTSEFFRCGAGYGVALVIIAAFFVRNDEERWFVWMCLAGAIPLIVVHYLGKNHNPRLIAPSILLLCAAAASAARRRWIPLLIPIAAAQVMAMSIPTTLHVDSYIWRGVTEVNAPAEQWDWAPVRIVAESRGMLRPSIAILGESYGFNGPQIRHAWYRVERDVPVTSLYHPDVDPSFVMPRMLDEAAQSQMVITVPGLRGDPSDGQPPINVFNSAFAAALSHDPRFVGPIVLDVGAKEPVNAVVFLRNKTLRSPGALLHGRG